LRVEFETKTRSEANERGFWTATNRKKAQDRALEAALTEALVAQPIPSGPWCVRLTRLGASRLDDDNLGSAFKRIRDRMAEVIGVKDNEPSIAFCVAQERRAGPLAVRVEVWGGSARQFVIPGTER
jgi:hypothetical protein